ncbi:MAG: hypothetical protein FWE24_07840 [Defluviitaleaceae bacterium]|nr:hypothetical protein [Defluviitaleaceae bacterium]
MRVKAGLSVSFFSGGSDFPNRVKKFIDEILDSSLYSVYRTDNPQLDPRLDPRLNSPAFWWVEYRMF